MKPALWKVMLPVALLLSLTLSCAGPSRPDIETGIDSHTETAPPPPVTNASDNSSDKDPSTALLVAEDYDRVIAEVNAALESDPEDIVGRERLADAYIARAWYYKAKRLNPYTLNDLGRALEVAPDYYRSHYELGRFHNNQWQFSIGLLYLNKAVSLKPEFAPAYSERSYSNYRNREYEAALADVDKAISLDAGDGQFYYMRSLVYRGMGKNDLAAGDLETTLRLSKDDLLTARANADLQKLQE